MRINVFVAAATGLSRRTADQLIADGQVKLNGQIAKLGDQVNSDDHVTLKGQPLRPFETTQTILLNKPIGYVCSRDGQGSKTIYDLLSPELHHLKPVGRLDKDSSGLLLLTTDGKLAYQLTHPSFNKQKVYEIELDKPLEKADFIKLTQSGVNIGDKQLSRFLLVAGSKQYGERERNLHTPYYISHTTAWLATLTEGRNRQIRRTFETLGYKVIKLHRAQFGDYKLKSLTEGKYLLIE